MHIERVHFDEVFDEQAMRGDFSFRSAGQARYGVHLHGEAIPLAGSTYFFALSSRDDWSSPLGWMDVQTKTILLKEPTWLGMLSSLGSFIWLAPFFLGAAFLVGGPNVALAVMLTVCCVYCWQLCKFVDRNRRIRQALREADVEATKTIAYRQSAPCDKQSVPP